MDKYLKMADVFKGELFIDRDCDDVIVDGLSLTVLESFSGSDVAKFALHAISSHDELVAEVGLLRSVCAEAYQMAGALDAPVEVLDNLSAAANGEDLPHETFLPVASHDLIAEVERLRESLKWAVENLPFENAFEWSDDENANAHYAALRLLGVKVEE